MSFFNNVNNVAIGYLQGSVSKNKKWSEAYL